MRRIILVLGVLSLSANALAVNQTPTSKTAFIFQPYMFHLGDGGGACYSAALDQGYVVTKIEQSSATTNPQVGISQMFGGLPASHGIFFIGSHGSTTGIAGEAYEFTAAGLAARDFDFNFYQANGYAGLIYKGTEPTGGGHHIGVYAAAIGGSYVSANSIVYVLACEAHSWNATGWPGSRCRLGYSATCNSGAAANDARTFWENMGGLNGVYNRPASLAMIGTGLQLAGDGATTLTPWVSNFSHSSGTNIPGTLNIYWEFDTPTNQAANPVSVSGIVQLASYTWTSSTKLAATVQSTGKGDGYATARGGIIASANTNLLLLNGGEDYSVRLTHSDNPAADVYGVTYRDGVVTFKVGSEPDAGPGATSHYEIEVSQSAAEPWVAVGSIAAGAGHRSATIGSAHSLARVVEVEEDGDRVVFGSAKLNAVGADAPPARQEFEEDPLDRLDRLKDEARVPASRASALSGESVVAYTIPSLVSITQSQLASFWSDWGATVTVVSTSGMPTDPDAFRTALKADIALRVSNGADAVLLVGDANDHRQFTGVEYPTLWLPQNGWEAIRQNYLNGGYVNQSSRDGIPTFYTPDTDPRGVNMGYVTPYWMSDWPYVDVDDDGLPDVPITRLPFTSTEDLYAYVSKLWMTQDGNYGANGVGLFVGDVDQAGNDGDAALASMNSIAAVAAGKELEWLYESDYPSAVQRNTAAAGIWNSERPEIVFILGTLSNRSYPGGFFDQAVSPPFTMDYLQAHSALVVALSCGGANFAQTEDSDYGRPVGERFLAEWFKGAIAWVGPTVGTWQHANDDLAVAFAEELFEDFSRPIASSYLIALRRILTDFAEDAEVVRCALSTTVLGDPLVRVSEAPVITATEGTRRYRFELGQNEPNPFNPTTRIRFSLPSRSRVSLRIYDVRGKYINTLVEDSYAAGPHSVVWNGKDSDGNEVASGLYFYRLSTEGRTESRKMLLLK